MMEHADRENSYFQLIDSHGTFNDAGLKRFLKTSIPSETRTSYRVISIMGPQSSGKSTLLNFLFGTNFPTMNGFVRRGLTTRGVWMAKCENIKPCTIVMDTEGSDGAQREGNTVFENQSTVFAVAISDVLIINMKNDDIGRNQAANRPLLRIVFKAMMKLYGENPPRKTTLMFIIRDRSVTADYILEQLIREDIEKLWHSFERPRAHQETSWNVYFDVQVVSLPTYIQERDGEQYAMDNTEQENRRLNERFKREVARLKQRFGESTDAPVDGLVEEIQGAIILLDAPASGLVGETQNTTIHISGFALSTREMWRKIKEDKDLNQASHRIKAGNMFQLIDADGTFNYDELQGFANTFPARTGTSYFTVSIIGPQSGGKSTLLNALFGTNFTTMNGFEARAATTQGVWIARGEDIGPCTIVMDIEGTDGAQSEGDTTFEKRSALFAFAISDVVMININCNAIGLAHGGCRPLLRIIFQAILNLVGDRIPRKTTLVFVIRDRVNPPHVLERHLQRDIQEIWISFEKPPAHQDTSFDAFFNVEVVSLVQYTEVSNGEHRIEDEMEEGCRKQNDKFSREVEGLKQRLRQLLAPGEVAGDRPEEDLIPIRNFPSSTREVWLKITDIGFSDMASHLEEIRRKARQEERIRAREDDLTRWEADLASRELDLERQIAAAVEAERTKGLQLQEFRGTSAADHDGTRAEDQDIRQLLALANSRLQGQDDMPSNNHNRELMKMLVIGLGLGIAAGLGIGITIGMLELPAIHAAVATLGHRALVALPALGRAVAEVLPDIQERIRNGLPLQTATALVISHLITRMTPSGVGP